MSRAEQYIHLATHVRNRASRESNPILKAEWENLARLMSGSRLCMMSGTRMISLTIRFRICWIALGIDRFDTLDQVAQVAKSMDRQLAVDGP